MTLLALVPLGAVAGYIFAARTQGDSITCTLVGAAIGVLVGLYSTRA
jgi:hypothetical protein